MNDKKLIKIIVITLLVFILVIGITIVINTNNNKDLSENINLINDNYNELKEKTDIFNENRINIYDNILNNFYYEEVNDNYDTWNQLLKEYENSATSMDNTIEVLDEKCNYNYQDSDIKNKCSNYKKTYESIINTLVNDIQIYNEQIGKYNEWVKEENNIYETKEKYISKYSNYIDYNNDNVFSGK